MATNSRSFFNLLYLDIGKMSTYSGWLRIIKWFFLLFLVLRILSQHFLSFATFDVIRNNATTFYIFRDFCIISRIFMSFAKIFRNLFVISYIQRFSLFRSGPCVRLWWCTTRKKQRAFSSLWQTEHRPRSASRDPAGAVLALQRSDIQWLQQARLCVIQAPRH